MIWYPRIHAAALEVEARAGIHRPSDGGGNTGTRTAAPLLPLPPYPRATAESCFAFTGERKRANNGVYVNPTKADATYRVARCKAFAVFQPSLVKVLDLACSSVFVMVHHPLALPCGSFVSAKYQRPRPLPVAVWPLPQGTRTVCMCVCVSVCVCV